MNSRSSAIPAWFGGHLASCLPWTAFLWWRSADFTDRGLWVAFVAIQLTGTLWILFGSRKPSASRSAFAAGFGTGALTAIALACRAPGAWFMSDVAWHSAKVAVAAAGHPLQDPILRTPTIYPFAFNALVGIPVALGLSLRTAMWAVTPVSLIAGLFAFWWMARARLEPREAALCSISAPLAFYFPQAGFVLLPSPFNLSLAPLFWGLGLWLRAEQDQGRRRTALAALALGGASLMWYAHLVWVTLACALWAVRRPSRLAPLALGALLPACVLGVHAFLLWRSGNWGDAAITGSAPEQALSDRLLAMGRNMMSLSGGHTLSGVPFWIGPLFGLVWLVRIVRGPSAGTRASGVSPSVLTALLFGLIFAGLKLTYWEPFSWRYAFLFYALLGVVIASSRPFSWFGRELSPILVPACAALIFVPGWLLPRIDTSLDFSQRFEGTHRAVGEFLEQHSSFDEPVFASTETWEQAIAITAPRPSLVDRFGGTFKYAPAFLARPRWRDSKKLEPMTDAAQVAELLEPYGFRLAVVSRKDRGRFAGYRALADGFEVLFENEDFRILDLTRGK